MSGSDILNPILALLDKRVELEEGQWKRRLREEKGHLNYDNCPYCQSIGLNSIGSS